MQQEAYPCSLYAADRVLSRSYEPNCASWHNELIAGLQVAAEVARPLVNFEHVVERLSKLHLC
jgi:hypothetical protein